MTIQARFDNIPQNAVISPWVGRSGHGAYLGSFYDRHGNCWISEGRQEKKVVVFDEWYVDETDMLEWSRVGRIAGARAYFIMFGSALGGWAAMGAAVGLIYKFLAN